MKQARGFSLIEVVIVLAILAAIIGLLAPTAYQAISSARGSDSQVQLQSIHQAILGDQVTTFGYYGDVGDFPVSLMDLARDPTGSTAGWKGPYLSVPAGSVSSSTLLDSFGNPFEYYLLDNITNLPHRLAVISRGSDGSSTNTSVTPNTWTSFAGTLPTANGYLAGTDNGDNLVYPLVDSTSNNLLLQRSTLGTFSPVVTNVDSNAVVLLSVPVCPALFTMTLTSAARGSLDVRTEKLSPGLSVDLQQGAWQAIVTSPIASAPVMSQTFNILPNKAVSPVVNLSGINSAGTANMTLQVFNGTAGILDVWINNVKNVTTVGVGATVNYAAVPGCAPVRIHVTTTNTVRDSFTMPYVSTYLRNVGTAQQTVTVTNGSLTGTTPPTANAITPEVRVYLGTTVAAGVQIGQVAKGKSKVFTVSNKDNVIVTDNVGAIKKTFSAIAGNVSTTCVGTGGGTGTCP